MTFHPEVAIACREDHRSCEWKHGVIGQRNIQVVVVEDTLGAEGRLGLWLRLALRCWSKRANRGRRMQKIEGLTKLASLQGEWQGEGLSEAQGRSVQIQLKSSQVECQEEDRWGGTRTVEGEEGGGSGRE